MSKYEELVQNKSSELIESLLRYVLAEDTVEILFDCMDADEWSIISMHEYEEDTQVSLRLHLNDMYDLFLGYYDDKDEFQEIVRPLTEEQKEILPNGLRKLMKKVLDDEKGMRLPSSFLTK